MKNTDTNKIYKPALWLYRFFVIVAIYCVVFALSYLFDPELKEAEKTARTKIVSSQRFRRGDILSADGKPLAAYYPEYILYADFNVRIGERFTVDKSRVKTGKKPKESVKLDTFRINIYKELSKSLAKVGGGDAGSYYRELYSNRVKAENAKREKRDERHTEDLLKHKKIDIFQRDEILENPYFRKRGRNTTGVYADETPARKHPLGENFARSAVGVFQENNVTGIEKTYNENLKNGDNVITTIDIRMQDICETVLRDAISGDENKRFVGGTIAVMDVSTGDIKAMANAGMYSMEKYSGVRDIYNNATGAAIEPGSTFKTVSLMLALETGKVSISDRFNTKKGRWFKQPEKHSHDSIMTVSEIIEKSLNTGTGNMVDRAFDKSTGKFVQAIKDLGILDRIGDLNETAPWINSKTDSKSVFFISHGYQVKMAPIHILSFYNAIANGGIMVRPRLVCGTVSRSTGEREMFSPEIINPAICSKTTLDSVRKVLSRVVGQGSAAGIARTKYGIAGKTGTAQIYTDKGNYANAGDSRELASFCGYFPENSPKYSCIVVLYTKFLNTNERKNFSASSTAVPLFKKVSDKIWALYTGKEFEPAKNPVRIPAVKNTAGKNLSVISETLN
ncbi:MAG: hypothetical protein LBQ01_06695, partial [Prevotellaceae bacterium]|nr:hypothetical protein [Prevotellaceae bacterium]